MKLITFVPSIRCICSFVLILPSTAFRHYAQRGLVAKNKWNARRWNEDASLSTSPIFHILQKRIKYYEYFRWFPCSSDQSNRRRNSSFLSMNKICSFGFSSANDKSLPRYERTSGNCNPKIWRKTTRLNSSDNIYQSMRNERSSESISKSYKVNQSNESDGRKHVGSIRNKNFEKIIFALSQPIEKASTNKSTNKKAPTNNDILNEARYEKGGKGNQSGKYPSNILDVANVPISKEPILDNIKKKQQYFIDGSERYLYNNSTSTELISKDLETIKNFKLKNRNTFKVKDDKIEIVSIHSSPTNIDPRSKSSTKDFQILSENVNEKNNNGASVRRFRNETISSTSSKCFDFGKIKIFIEKRNFNQNSTDPKTPNISPAEVKRSGGAFPHSSRHALLTNNRTSNQSKTNLRTNALKPQISLENFSNPPSNSTVALISMPTDINMTFKADVHKKDLHSAKSTHHLEQKVISDNFFINDSSDAVVTVPLINRTDGIDDIKPNEFEIIGKYVSTEQYRRGRTKRIFKIKNFSEEGTYPGLIQESKISENIYNFENRRYDRVDPPKRYVELMYNRRASNIFSWITTNSNDYGDFWSKEKSARMTTKMRSQWLLMWMENAMKYNVAPPDLRSIVDEHCGIHKTDTATTLDAPIKSRSMNLLQVGTPEMKAYIEDSLIFKARGAFKSLRNKSSKKELLFNSTGSLPAELGPKIMKSVRETFTCRLPRVIVIGDVHGCIVEFQELIRQCDFRPGDLLLLLGDLVTKGPYSSQVVTMARELGALCVRGNHDFEVIRYCGDSAKDKVAQPSNSVHYQIAQSLSEEDIKWLKSLPWYIQSTDLDALFVHAGFVDGIRLLKQNPRIMMTLRSLLPDRTPSPKYKEGCPWAKYWKGPQTVFFGHDADRGLQVYDYAVGIDTGCVYGGKLTACILPEKRLVSVDSHWEYVKYKKRMSI